MLERVENKKNQMIRRAQSFDALVFRSCENRSLKAFFKQGVHFLVDARKVREQRSVNFKVQTRGVGTKSADGVVLVILNSFFEAEINESLLVFLFFFLINI